MVLEVPCNFLGESARVVHKIQLCEVIDLTDAQVKSYARLACCGSVHLKEALKVRVD
jgi:hypothetical protein